MCVSTPRLETHFTTGVPRVYFELKQRESIQLSSDLAIVKMYCHVFYVSSYTAQSYRIQHWQYSNNKTDKLQNNLHLHDI